MAIRKTPVFWTASLAAITAGGLVACEAPDDRPAAGGDHAAAASSHASAGHGEGGEGGEAGEAGEGGEEGGEFGIDTEAAATDPVVYLSAIEVMRAHYLAGLAALQAGERAAASEMFSHPVSEIYIDFEPVIEARGGTVMLEEMNQAAVLHFQGASREEIEAAVAVVLDLLDANEAVAPMSDESQARIDAAVIVDLGERAALQYGFVQSDAAAGEAWLDAYGFNAAAQSYAEGRLAAIAREDAELGAALQSVLSALEAALGAFDGPAPDAPAPAAVSDAVQAARAALQGA